MNHAAKVRHARELAYLLGLYTHAIASWQLVLFALNRRYPVIDKGGRHMVNALPLMPKNFEFRAKAILRAASAGELQASNAEAKRLQAEMDKMVEAEAPKTLTPEAQRDLIGAQDGVLLSATPAAPAKAAA